MVADSLARTVNRLVADRAADPDSELLRRFVAARDEAAFAALVRRHGPMVFGVCRRTLGHVQDAEDAFQAVFLVLARKAHTVRPDGLSRWLYGVSVRVANKARGHRARHTPAAVDLAEVAAPPAPPPPDWLPLLDAALARLPDRDRNPILLCDLLGRSRAEAAAELEIAEGTLSSRLARARDKLRARLARLGAALSLPTLTAGLADQVTGAVPASLLESTIAVGSSAGAARELADGVLRTMLLAKVLKLSALGMCAIGMAAAAVAWLPAAGADPTGGNRETPRGSPPAKEAPKADSDLERLQGTWMIESVKAAAGLRPGGRGAKTSWEDTKEKPITFSGDRIEFRLFPGDLHLFRLDPARDPKRIDFIIRHLIPGGFGGGSGAPRIQDQSRPAIYKFDGDKLQIAIGDEELRERPDSFEWSGPKSPFVHLVLRRPTDDERASQERAESDQLQGTWVGATETVRGQERAAPRELQLVVKGDRLRFDVPGSESLHARFVLDLSTAPWHIDLTATEDGGGVKKGATVRGIFARQGGFLSLALGTTGRPPSFEAAGKEGKAYVLIRQTMSNRYVDLLRPTGAPPAGRPETAPKSSTARLRQLQQERVKALEEQLQGQYERVKIGKDPLIQLLDAVRDLAEAELEIAETEEVRVKAVEKMLKQFVEIEKELMQLQEAGLQTKQGVAQAKAARLKAEIQLEKLKLGR